MLAANRSCSFIFGVQLMDRDRALAESFKDTAAVAAAAAAAAQKAEEVPAGQSPAPSDASATAKVRRGCRNRMGIPLHLCPILVLTVLIARAYLTRIAQYPDPLMQVPLAQITARVAAEAAALRAALASGLSEEEVAFEQIRAQERRVRNTMEALVTLASSSALSAERATFMRLVRTEADLIKSRVEKGGGQMLFSGGQLVAPKEVIDIGSSALASSVDDMLARIERDMDHAEDKLGNRMRILDQDEDGVISREELLRGLEVRDGRRKGDHG